MDLTARAGNEADGARGGATATAGPLVPVLAGHDIKSWPKFASGGRARYVSLAAALKAEYRTDAHFCAYSVPAKPRRLSSGAVRVPAARAELGDGVPMVAVVFDVDFPKEHAGESAVGEIDVWWAEEREKIRPLLAAHPGGYVYRTRGGYRIVYALEAPVVLSTPDDERTWSARYCAWIEYLRRVFGILADPACKDWTRLYRLPHATRDNGPHPERRETIGDVDRIGAWVCAPSPEDEAVGRASNPAKAPPPRSDLPAVVAPDESLLVKLFAARGWLGDAAGGGWLAICDNADAHTKGQDFDGSTILYPASNGNTVGWLDCLHAHCRHRKPGDVLRSFTRAQIDAASPPKTRSNNTEVSHDDDGGWCPDETGPSDEVEAGHEDVPDHVAPPDATTGGGTPEPAPSSVTGSTSPLVRDQRFDLPDDGNAPRFTDEANARRLVARHGRDIRYVPGLGWLAWDGKRWRAGAELDVLELAKDAARHIWDEGTHERDSAKRKKISEWCAKSCSAGALAAMVNLARSIPEIRATVEDFDQHPHLFNAANGTIDLRTGALRKHDRADLLTRVAPVAFDPAARCPSWDAFLARVQPDPDVRAFLQRRVGYALTGETREETFDIDFGTGANGKSTFTETVADAVGPDYAGTLPVSALTDRRDRAGNTPELAKARGARLARVSETAEGVALNMATVKSLTGRDTIYCCAKYEAPFEYRPTYKLWLATNFRPDVRGGTEGEWRRITMTPWTVTIPAAERDVTMRERLLAPEAPGILAWAVEGARKWYEAGLAPPDAVRATTKAYREESDTTLAFLNDCADVAPWRSVRASEIHATYGRWAEENGYEPLNAKALAARLKNAGYAVKKGTGGVRTWVGLSLKTPTSDASGG